MIVVTQSFRLADGVGREAFLAADKTLQEDVLHQDPGFIRRTVAYSEERDEWSVVTFLWDEATNADPKLVADLIDASSLDTRAYQDIGG